MRKYPCDRLYLRIACRTVNWPSALESGLKEIWGNDNFSAFELTPLRRLDVVEAAKSNNLAPDLFLADIDRMEAVPLAIKPVTLQFLINSYLKTGRFPSKQADLYRQGCQILCEETSDSRRSAGLIGDFTAEERLTVASRIAAITVFSNRYAVWTGFDHGNVPEEDITISELGTGSEIINGRNFQVTEAAIKETLGTGLFSSRGMDRMGWGIKPMLNSLQLTTLSTAE